MISLIKILKTNFTNLKQILNMSKMEMKKHYSSSTLGTIWAFIKPALFVLVYWFGIEVGLKGGGSIGYDGPYILWLLAGILPWFFISECLIQGGTSIRTHRHLVTKMVYPISTIPTFVETYLFKVHLMLVAIATFIFVVTGHFPVSNFYFVQILYGFICLFLLMWVINLLMSALVVVSRDFEYLLKSITTILFWLSPILWDESKLASINSGALANIIYYVVKLNPITYVGNIYRYAFLGTDWFFNHPLQILCFWLEILVLAIIGSFVFKRLESEFADIL